MRDLATVELERIGPTLIARISGELDLTNADSVERALERAISNDLHRVVLDLAGLSFLDSSGLRAVLRLAGRLRTRQQTLMVAVPEQSHVRRILVLTRVDAVARLFVSLDEAVAAP
jgi:anti-anti-sigma factor